MRNRHDQANRKKAVALSAAGLVLVAGATVTSLAAWTDTEWIFGGAGSNPGIGTSKFNVQQNVTTDATSWNDRESRPGGQIDFSTQASSLVPGDTVYAFVRLRTAEGSVAGDLTLNADDPMDGSSQLLYNALIYQAGQVSGPADCNAAGLAQSVAEDKQLIAAGSTMGADAVRTFELKANSANEETICFALTLPDTATNRANKQLQGQTATPVWNFEAISK